MQRKIVFLFFSLFLIGILHAQQFQVGDAVDSLNHVKVYYNGTMRNVHGRNVVDGYNVGLKYQCVEFAKRYYFEYYQHRMPDSYGHAKSFYNPQFKDGEFNIQRGLIQYANPSSSMPKIGDLLVMDEEPGNPFGHVAIISLVEEDSIEIIQQNKDNREPTRVFYPLTQDSVGYWKIEDKRILGRLRKEIEENTID